MILRWSKYIRGSWKLIHLTCVVKTGCSIIFHWESAAPGIRDSNQFQRLQAEVHLTLCPSLLSALSVLCCCGRILHARQKFRPVAKGVLLFSLSCSETAKTWSTRSTGVDWFIFKSSAFKPCLVYSCILGIRRQKFVAASEVLGLSSCVDQEIPRVCQSQCPQDVFGSPVTGSPSSCFLANSRGSSLRSVCCRCNCSYRCVQRW